MTTATRTQQGNTPQATSDRACMLTTVRIRGFFVIKLHNHGNSGYIRATKRRQHTPRKQREYRHRTTLKWEHAKNSQSSRRFWFCRRRVEQYERMLLLDPHVSRLFRFTSFSRAEHGNTQNKKWTIEQTRSKFSCAYVCVLVRSSMKGQRFPKTRKHKRRDSNF